MKTLDLICAGFCLALDMVWGAQERLGLFWAALGARLVTIDLELREIDLELREERAKKRRRSLRVISASDVKYYDIDRKSVK